MSSEERNNFSYAQFLEEDDSSSLGLFGDPAMDFINETSFGGLQDDCLVNSWQGTESFYNNDVGSGLNQQLNMASGTSGDLEINRYTTSELAASSALTLMDYTTTFEGTNELAFDADNSGSQDSELQILDSTAENPYIDGFEAAQPSLESTFSRPTGNFVMSDSNQAQRPHLQGQKTRPIDDSGGQS
ncbi:MAG: hypothetical protein Q9227_005280 [Pyrenula ochraceoflavens]